jgi:two-component system, chemotaxis family, chemotaxis protein CheY
VQDLVVEDSTTIRMILRQLLSERGFRVVEASNGLEGLERLKEMDQTTVVMVDWNMPKMSGIDFVGAVRTQRAYDVLPLIIATTNIELEHRYLLRGRRQ